MAIVLKRPSGPSKGLVVFTHKERHLLDLGAPVLGEAIELCRRRYFFAMHWGWHHEAQPAYPVDVHIARESTVTFRPDVEVERIPLNSAMFTPSYYRPRPGPKELDVFSVTRTLKAKRTDQLLECMRRVYDLRPETRAFVVCIAPPEPLPRGHHRGLRERYLETFSEAERERFTFLYLQGLGSLPLSRRDIAYLYASSRVFTLFSDLEGESRVLKEALMCGLPVMVKRHLRGGGQDFLDESNARFFDGPEDGAETLLGMLDGGAKLTVDAAAMADRVGEAANAPRFVAALRDAYERRGMPFDGDVDTDDLSRKLPSHARTLPRELCLADTDDLRSPAAMVLFLRMLERDLPIEAVALEPSERARLHAFERLLRARDVASKIRRRMGIA